MNQEEPTVDNDLQKAIDDITNTTDIDPVFSDPVAAPSSVPEGDTGELAEAVGPFPEPKIELSAPPLPAEPEMPTIGGESLTSDAGIGISVNTVPAGLNMRQIREAALRDLLPLIDKLNMTPTQKFRLYRDIFENLKDYTVLESAYHAATEIPDEKERAEALLYLVESIDKM